MHHKRIVNTEDHLLTRTLENRSKLAVTLFLLTGLLRSARRMFLPSTWSRNLRRASSSVGLCPALPSFPRTRPLSRASR